MNWYVILSQFCGWFLEILFWDVFWDVIVCDLSAVVDGALEQILWLCFEHGELIYDFEFFCGWFGGYGCVWNLWDVILRYDCLI